MKTRKKNLNKIKLLIVFLILIPIFLLLSTHSVLAATQFYNSLNYQPQVQIPVSGSGLDKASTTVGTYNSKTGVMSSDLLARYIQAIYSYGLTIATILAVIVLMGAGLLWLTSAGNDARITQAKEMISGSVVGLLILFGSWMLLNTINPNLLKLQIIQTQIISPEYLNPDGMILNLKDVPADMKYGWICMGDTKEQCQDNIPASVNLGNNICTDGKPNNQKPANCPYGQLWCCGQSQSDAQKSNICQGQPNGTACRVASTATLGSGYCYNNKCVQCKVSGIDATHEGAACSNHYECKNVDYTCGNINHGYCFCNIVGNNCTCRYNQPVF